jgi:hypothetical protein
LLVPPYSVDRLNARVLNERRAFALFIKILFYFLSSSDDLKVLYRMARSIVFECTHQNRARHEHYLDLQHAVASRLRLLVGEMYWQKSRSYLETYFARQGIQHAHIRALD